MPKRVLYVGTHRRPHKADPDDIAFGIYVFQHNNLIPGHFQAAGLSKSPQPGWLTLHPDGRVLYAVNEVGEGGVSAFSINPETGSLTLLNIRSTPPFPCHCDVDASGRFLLVVTNRGGTVQLFPIDPDGRLGEESDIHRHNGSSVHPRRQSMPHPHAVAFDPGNRFVLVPDLGLDQILVYELNLGCGKLIPRPDRNTRITPGAGPRHVVFDKLGRFFYVINELSARVTVFAYDPKLGSSEEIQTVDLLPNGFTGHRSGAEVGIHPSGRFLYATTRSHGSSGEQQIPGLDNIVWFQIDDVTGMLRVQGTVASGGEVPRSFTFDNTGDYLFVGNQCSGSIVTFRIDNGNGAPLPTGDIIYSPVPVCLLFVKDDSSLHR